MADKKGYKFARETPPKRASRGRSNFYPSILADFIKSGDPSWKITETDKKPLTLNVGLAKAVKESDPAVPARVRKSGDDVFLVRTDMDE